MKPITGKQLEVAVRPVVEAFVRELAAAQAAALNEMLGRALETAKAGALAALAPKPEPKAAPKPRAVRKQRAAKPAPQAPQQPQPTPARPAASTGPRCGKCGTAGHNARTCRVAKPAADADAEEEPARAPRPSRAVEPAEERVIPHAALVRMLAADRAENAVGDAGGFVARTEREPRIVGTAEGTREVCHVHGWVGRHAFERDNHAGCDPVGAPCSHCGGSKVTSSHFCQHCDGTGIEPPQVEAVVTPPAVPEIDTSIFVGDSRDRRRDPNVQRSSTIAPKRITRAMLREGAAGLETELGEIDALRPKTRAACVDGPRPCPWVSCRHHLALDINPETGSIKINFPDREPWEIDETCALDVAERGEHTLEEVGTVLNVTRERLRQIEYAGLVQLKQHRTIRRGIGPGEFTERGSHALAEVE